MLAETPQYQQYASDPIIISQMMLNKKQKHKKNNLSEGQTPNIADLTQMELQQPCFEQSWQGPVDVFSLYQQKDSFSFESPMHKKLSYQLNLQQEQFGNQLHMVAYGSANKSVVHHSVNHSQTTEDADLRDNLSLCQKQKAGCKCKKIGCLKLYCQCFAQGKICGKHCICEGCANLNSNTEGIERARLEAKLRVPNCFRNMEQKIPEKVCNCQKSKCQKKYCECFSSGMSCNSFCNCKDCLNVVVGDRGSIKQVPLFKGV